MAYAYRVYQLFRVFWVQNTLACCVGGAICFLLLTLTQFSIVFYKGIEGTLRSYYIQILPETEVAINPAAVAELTRTIEPLLPELILSSRRDDQLSFEYLNILGVSQEVAIQEGLEIPNHLIVGKLIGEPQAEFESRLQQVQALAGVKTVDADLNVLEFLSQLIWALPLVIGGMTLLLCILLFYLIQFIVSQLFMARHQELTLEYVLGATQHYQKSPFVGFILMICVSSLGIAFVGWVFGVYPHVDAVMGWIGRLGMHVQAGSARSLNLHYPVMVGVFALSFVTLMMMVFGWVWRFHFGRIVRLESHSGKRGLNGVFS